MCLLNTHWLDTWSVFLGELFWWMDADLYLWNDHFYQWNSCCESDGVIFYFESDPIFRMIILRVGRNHESLAVSHEGWANPRRAVYCILKYSQVANPMGVAGGPRF